MSRDEKCEIPCYKGDVVARLKAQAPSDRTLQRLSRLFGILSDPTRLKIIGALASGEELCVCDVANVVGLSLSATSHQLRKLRDASVLVFRNDGRMAYYRLEDGFAAGLMHQAIVQLERSSVGDSDDNTTIVEQVS